MKQLQLCANFYIRLPLYEAKWVLFNKCLVMYKHYHTLAKQIETGDKNLRLVFWFISQKRSMIESKIKLEVKTIDQEL